ncbi:unnamed protein product [Didymodactylos carnosus]|uniref:Nucleotidyltransferase n=2 Tax=Didymodactylos carnosus TaxID=1234261 RepID=A0A8S2ECT3_9BILA|nr:unnamed protein product [Didymodactylos carnosus]CAF3984797.1 unnamed protein product [Didymodactylos carnosus]
MGEPYKMFVSGSSKEGQSDANHFRHDKRCQDFDIMIEIGLISSMDSLESIPNVPGFVRVLSCEETVQLKYSIDYPARLIKSLHPLPTENEYINATKIKEIILNNIKSSCTFGNTISDSRTYVTGPLLASVEATAQLNYAEILDYFNLFLDYINPLPQSHISDDEVMKRFKEFAETEVNVGRQHVVAFLQNVVGHGVYDVSAQKQLTKDVFSTISPLFGYRLPNDLRKKIEAVLEFYFRYRSYLPGLDALRDVYSSAHDQQNPLGGDTDYVPCLRLEF